MFTLFKMFYTNITMNSEMVLQSLNLYQLQIIILHAITAQAVRAIMRGAIRRGATSDFRLPSSGLLSSN